MLRPGAGRKRRRALQSRSASCLHKSAASFGKSVSFSVKVCTHTAARRPHTRSAKMKVLSVKQSLHVCAHMHAFSSLVGGARAEQRLLSSCGW